MAGFLNFGFGGEGQKVPKLWIFLVRRGRGWGVKFLLGFGVGVGLWFFQVGSVEAHSLKIKAPAATLQNLHFQYGFKKLLLTAQVLRYSVKQPVIPSCFYA